jgi:hypothetical protein
MAPVLRIIAPVFKIMAPVLRMPAPDVAPLILIRRLGLPGIYVLSHVLLYTEKKKFGMMAPVFTCMKPSFFV